VAGRVIGLAADTVTAIAAVAIAAVALAVAIWQVRVSLVHHRLSFKPLLRLDFRDSDRSAVALTLRNIGLGPGIIRRVTIYVDGAEVPGAEHPNPTVLWRETFRASGIPLDVLNTAMCPAPGEAIGPHESTDLMCFPETSADAELSRRLVRSIGRLRVRIQYESMYAERLEPLDVDLSRWLPRE